MRLLPLLLVLLVAFGCKDRATEERGKSEPPAAKLSSGNVVAGEMFPELKFKDLDGVEHTLAEYRGKVVLLNFWATWCNPCVAEMPALERLYQSLKADNFVIVAVSVDAGEQNERVRQFMKDKGLSFVVLRDETLQAAQALGVSGFPETFFIDKEGRFAPFHDPIEGELSVRIISDRPWDSAKFVESVREIM